MKMKGIYSFLDDKRRTKKESMPFLCLDVNKRAFGACKRFYVHMHPVCGTLLNMGQTVHAQRCCYAREEAEPASASSAEGTHILPHRCHLPASELSPNMMLIERGERVVSRVLGACKQNVQPRRSLGGVALFP